jgi:hypothetical protein
MTTLSQTLLWSSVAVAITAAASTPPTTRQTPSSSPSVQTTTVEPSTVRGDPLDPSAIGPSWVETMEDAVRRDRATPPPRGIQKVPEPESPYEEEVERQKREASRDTTTGHQSFGGGGSIPTIGTNFVGPREGERLPSELREAENSPRDHSSQQCQAALDGRHDDPCRLAGELGATVGES